MKKYFKKSIVLTIVPAFVFVGCSADVGDNERLAVPNTEVESVVQTNDDGSYSSQQSAQQSGQELQKAYEEAKASGYTGTLEEFVELAALYDSNPEQAQEVAKESGFDGSDLVLGALAGAAIGAVAAGAMNNSSSSYSAQRANNAYNYAYSQPQQKKEQQSSSAGGYGGTAAAGATAARTGSSQSLNSTPSNSSATTTTRTTTTVRSAPTPKASYSSVSRGGFGGAVSSGG
jgi:hypothetical protein